MELEVTVSAGGSVETAHAINGPRQLVEEAERLEMSRTFRPYLREGVPITVRFHDAVSVDPPELWRDPHVPFPATFDPKTVLIGLTRTGCFGNCPSYEATIAGDGSIQFKGAANVLAPGNHSGHIPRRVARDLLIAFRDADFLSALGEYRAQVTDSPTQTLSLSIAGKTYKVVDYVGQEAGLPDVIQDLERQIDEVADTKQWIQGDEQTLSSLKAEAWPFSSVSADNVALYDHAIVGHHADLVDVFLAAKTPFARPLPTGTNTFPPRAPICVATAAGDSKLIERMMAHSMRDGKPAPVPRAVLDDCLDAAALRGDLSLVDFWLDHGADPLAQTKRDEYITGSILTEAIESANPAVVARILSYPVDLKQRTRGKPLLALAADVDNRAGDSAEIVTLLAQAGADIHATDENGNSAIFCEFCGPRTISALISAGAAVDARNARGETPLISGAYDLGRVEALLDAGADPAAVAGNGDTPLSRAKQMGCAECITAIQTALKKRSPHYPAIGTTSP